MRLYVVQLPIGGVRYYMLHVMLRVTGTVRTLAIVAGSGIGLLVTEKQRW